MDLVYDDAIIDAIIDEISALKYEILAIKRRLDIIQEQLPKIAGFLEDGENANKKDSKE